jgi:tetratricopeptide (TPR) repeat protein
MGRRDAAESVFVRTAEQQRRTLGDDSPETIRTLSNLVLVYMNQKRYAEAESLRLVTLERYGRVLGDEHPETLRAKATLGNLYSILGRLADAERVHTEVLEARERVFGPENAVTITSKALLAAVYGKQGRNEAAESLLAVVLDARRKQSPPDSLALAQSLGEYAILHWLMKRPDAAALAFEVADIYKGLIGDTDIRTIAWCYNSACYATMAGRRDEACRFLERIVADGGYADSLILTDADLGPLHGTPAFEELADVVRGRLAKPAVAASTD